MATCHRTAALIGYAVVLGLMAHISWCVHQGRKPLATLYPQG